MQEYITSFEDYLKKNNRSLYTISAYIQDLKQLDNFLLSRNKSEINSISPQDIIAFLKFLKISQYAPKSMFRKLNSIKAFFKYLEDTKVIKNNPSENVEYPKYTENTPRVLSETEYRALRDAARHDLRLSAMIELLLQTGIRIGELCRLQLEDIKIQKSGKSKVYIQPHTNNPAREVPLNESAQRAVKAYMQIRPKSDCRNLFITKTGKGLVVRNARALIDKMFIKSGIKNVKVNDLRNTFIAYNLANGIDASSISLLTGHKRISTTAKYQGLITEFDNKKKGILHEL